jgi:hypothetical protein
MNPRLIYKTGISAIFGFKNKAGVIVPVFIEIIRW